MSTFHVCPNNLWGRRRGVGRGREDWGVEGWSVCVCGSQEGVVVCGPTE